MSRVQMLRVLVNQRLTAAVEEIFGLFERTIEEYEEEVSRSNEENERQRKLLTAICVSTHSLQMSRVQMLRVLVNQRLTAAVEETFGLIEETVEEYEVEMNRQRRLLENVLRPEIQINKADSPQLLVCKVEVPHEQQEWSPSLDQKDAELRHIKEEQEELWTSQEGEQLQGLEEADIIKFPFSPVPVKSENDEEKPHSSQYSETQTEQNREAEPLASTSTEPMKTEADGEDCGVSESANALDLADDLEEINDGQLLSSDFSEIETEDSDEDWKETSEPHSGLDVLDMGEGPFSCTICGKTFSLAEHLNRHTINHSENKPFSCPVCGKGFHQKRNVQVHMKNHTGDLPFSCSVCGKRFGYKGILERHMTSHTGEKPFDCTVCGKGFGLKGHLQRHMKLHTGEKPFGCSVCGKRFTQRGTVVTHMRSHTMEKPFSCSVCGKRFSQSGTLGTHMRNHTGEKPFGCSVCNKSFSQRGALITHMRSHTGERPFSCSVCGKSFVQKCNLKTHLRIHTGEKPYSCSVCGKRFTRLSNIRGHKCGTEAAAGEAAGGGEKSCWLR